MKQTNNNLNGETKNMAYVNQEMKKEKAPAIKSILKKYGMKGTLAVRNHSTLVLNIKSGSLDLINDYIKTANPQHGCNNDKYIQINTYYINDNHSGKCLAFLLEIQAAMNTDNFDKSDIQTDYFHVGWYTDINVGQWDKPYTLN